MLVSAAAGDRYGGAEAGQRLQQAAEAERDQHRHDARVRRDEVERLAQVREAAADHGELIDPQRVEHNPHDWEQAEHGALGARQQRQAHGHLERRDRHDHGHGQRGQASPVRPDPEHAQQDEDRDQRKQGNERRRGEAAGHGRELLCEHLFPLSIDPSTGLG